MKIKFKPKKDKFDDIPKEFRENLEAASDEEIRSKIAKVAMDQEELMKAKEADQDFEEAKNRAKEAGAVYREGSKANKLKLAFAYSILEARGKA